jgi:hypothetical protein
MGIKWVRGLPVSSDLGEADKLSVLHGVAGGEVVVGTGFEPVKA